MFSASDEETNEITPSEFSRNALQFLKSLTEIENLGRIQMRIPYLIQVN
jgi:hypothetical protein